MEAKMSLKCELESLYRKKEGLQSVIEINQKELDILIIRIKDFEKGIAVLEDTEKGN